MCKIIFAILFVVTTLFVPTQVLAGKFYLDKGESKHFQLKDKIDTIFISAPNIADYEILDDNNFVVYAKDIGRTDINVLGLDGKQLISNTFFVNDAINSLANVNEQINIRFPKSSLRVKKIGQAYVIEGKAKSKSEAEKAARVVGAAIGDDYKVTKRKLGGEEISFLDSYEYKQVINNAEISLSEQINVKLTVVDVNKKFSESLGIDWTSISGNALKGLTNGATQIEGRFNNGKGSVAFLNANNLAVFINAINNKDNGKILAQPNISLLSGETSTFLVGGEIPLFNRNKNGDPTITYKSFGIKLDVGAKLLDNDKIRLRLNQEVSTLSSPVHYEEIKVPLFNIRRSSSTLELADGESFIIGGLYSSEDAEGLAKIPFLGDIPILGAFFRQAKTEKVERELVVVATVNLVKPVQGDDIVYPDFEKTGTLERFFNTTPFKNIYYRTLTTNFLKRGGFIQ
ncbi:MULTISPECIES: type II and III secretion system protein family protein [Pasteurellaceae]|uniref:Type II and III secretion system protein family protein n=1 Tax=Pasteurella atlantica TaxID=2827233 RepID=A0AAW8CHR3_9PAST|nr:type II and III secretion system protein family protein [Pasteurella atlantica]MBR0573545.1 type II and III secretion system protein family protein [Pasteurella atlantica]MDP8039596.1 type II and III secretion system protein family protein [Pasteurella atlantica]MDP8041687.1 type II and III secretion system protein family protein [Pasteurella atlantica]MDP8043822.1 type II and III secretion system protein family protein [Pasteurella atlantica]MDP8045908.1 type II and III secretion system pr